MKIGASTVLGTAGGFFQGDLPGTVCFVPLSCIQKEGLNHGEYVKKGWATRNQKAQSADLKLGSHIFPNLQMPITDEAICRQFTQRLEQEIA
jgi:hypothetical protein